MSWSRLHSGSKRCNHSNSAISALGHLDDPRAIPLIAALHSHPSEQIRFTVACALGSFPNDPLSVQTLLILMEDADADVRDWATFGLGVLGDQDTPEIREALFHRLNDQDLNAREEALVGLAKRHDTRILPDLISALEQSSIGDRVVEAAYTILELDQPKGLVRPGLYKRAAEAVFRHSPATTVN